MKRFYSVISRIYDDGKAVATLGESVEAEEKPKNTWRETYICDIYIDWFDTKKKASEFAKTV